MKNNLKIKLLKQNKDKTWYYVFHKTNYINYVNLCEEIDRYLKLNK